MSNKWFLKAWIYSLASMAVAGLICSSAFGQITQTISLGGGNLFSSYTLDSSLFLSPLAQSSSYSSTTTNLFATTSSQSSSYTDLFSTSWDNSYSYQNAFGLNYSTGSNFYSDPLLNSGGAYVNIGAPGSMYSSEYSYSNSILGGSSSYENSLVLPWTVYSSDVSTSYGMSSWPFTSTYSGASVALGTPTIYSGLGRYGEGIANLVSYAPISAQLDQALGDRPMYTADGMPFYATASYFNPYNASNYYFAPGVKTSAGGMTPAGYAGSASWVTGASASGVSGYPGGGYTGGGYTGGTGGSPAAGGFSAGGFSSIVYP
ncbi:MAG: hypothetical protein AB1847_00910 [bacterium]